MNVEEVKRISMLSKQEKWPYPRTFQKLMEAGVISYRTSITNNHTVYSGAMNQYEDNDVESASTLEIAKLFQADAVKRALVYHQKHKTPYADFLKDMADAGVQYYEVSMNDRTIHYTSGNPGEWYVEQVPYME